MRQAKPRQIFEKYDLERSPFSQQPTQKKVGELLGESRDDLRRMVNYKEQFIVRRTALIRGKVRELAYPVSRYRTVHEHLKFHLNKIRQPGYLFSPRKNYSQRDNAMLHLDQDQYLTLDLKKFYPSTTEYMVYNWFFNELKMYDDVARLLTKLCTIDGKVSLGSPLTPVLCALIHRPMFDRISDVCQARQLEHSLWVDDLTISGRSVPGQVIDEIREIIKISGLRSHKIKYRSGNRPVFITGIGVVGQHLVAPNSLNLKIKDIWSDLYLASTINEKDACILLLLGKLGTLRYMVGRNSNAGQKISDQMHSLRQKRHKMWDDKLKESNCQSLASAIDLNYLPEDVPFSLT
jgi:RNA-directed DNA polymerase